MAEELVEKHLAEAAMMSIGRQLDILGKELDLEAWVEPILAGLVVGHARHTERKVGVVAARVRFLAMAIERGEKE